MKDYRFFSLATLFWFDHHWPPLKTRCGQGGGGDVLQIEKERVWREKDLRKGERSVWLSKGDGSEFGVANEMN